MKRYFVLPISSGHKSGGLFVIYEYLELLGINIRDNNSIEKLSLIKVFYFYLFKRKFKDKCKIYILSPIGLFLVFLIKRFSKNIYYFSQADDSIIIASLLKDKFIFLPYYLLKKFFKNLLPLLINKNIKTIFSNSKFVALLNQNYSSNSKILILNLWTQLEHYKIGNEIINQRYRKDNLFLSQSSLKVGFMARNNYWKGSRHFNFLSENLNLTSSRDLEFIVQNANKKNKNYLGFKTIKDVSKFYSNIDIYVCTSDIEGFCLPIFEALLYGSIIVTTYQPAVIEYIPQELINNGVFMCDKLKGDYDLEVASNLLSKLKKALRFRKDLIKYKKFLKSALKWNKEKLLLYRAPIKNKIWDED